VSQSWVNGKVVLKRYTLIILYPIKRKFTSRPLEYNGQVYKTDPVKITVTAAVEQPRDPNDTSISVDDNLYLIADISKTNPYVNEPITVYKLYFSNNIGINNLSEVNKPKYNDFESKH
jgi:hypothetical protein